jgi:D-3-phosphoglycerate dehydrogenase
MKILVATDKAFAPVAVAEIRKVTEAAGYELALLENYKSVQELLTAVSDADGMIVRSDLVTSEVLDAAKKLKIVVRAGAGYDNLDLAACTAHNVVAMNTPGQNSNAVAELAFEMMLFQARSGFSGKSGSELRGKTFLKHW